MRLSQPLSDEMIDSLIAMLWNRTPYQVVFTEDNVLVSHIMIFPGTFRMNPHQYCNLPHNLVLLRGQQRLYYG